MLVRTGNIPKHWYDLYDHKGYSVKGKLIEKLAEKDELQKFLEKADDPEWWRNITDELNNSEVRLSKADLEMIMRLRKGKTAVKDDTVFRDMSCAIPAPKMPHSLLENEPKRRFVVSKWERLRVQKILKALNEGRMKTLEEKRQEKE